MDSSSGQFLCDECGTLFTTNKSRLGHVRTKHQGMKRIDNEKRKIEREMFNQRKRDDVAKKMKLSRTYNSDIKAAVMEKFKPTKVMCFHFVRDSPWTEDLKMRAEDCFEEIIRACIINKKLVIVEHASTEEVTDDNCMDNREAKL